MGKFGRQDSRQDLLFAYIASCILFVFPADGGAINRCCCGVECRRRACAGLIQLKLRMTTPPTPEKQAAKPIGPLASFIFMSRWLQLPLYLGLILAQCVYVYHFWIELSDLIGAVLGNANALSHILDAVTVEGAPRPPELTDTTIMLVVLGLIDVVMISNLLIMVIVGGYETFVSRMNLETHPDQPEWLSGVNASVLKVKLATAIIGISSIHLLRTFINAANYEVKVLMWQTIIHVVFLFSAIAIACTDRLMPHGPANRTDEDH